MPLDFHKPFQNKIIKLNNIINKSSDDLEIIYPETELSIKLREALENAKNS